MQPRWRRAERIALQYVQDGKGEEGSLPVKPYTGQGWGFLVQGLTAQGGKVKDSRDAEPAAVPEDGGRCHWCTLTPCHNSE